MSILEKSSKSRQTAQNCNYGYYPPLPPLPVLRLPLGPELVLLQPEDAVMIDPNLEIRNNIRKSLNNYLHSINNFEEDVDEFSDYGSDSDDETTDGSTDYEIQEFDLDEIIKQTNDNIKPRLIEKPIEKPQPKVNYKLKREMEELMETMKQYEKLNNKLNRLLSRGIITRAKRVENSKRIKYIYKTTVDKYEVRLE